MIAIQLRSGTFAVFAAASNLQETGTGIVEPEASTNAIELAVEVLRSDSRSPAQAVADAVATFARSSERDIDVPAALEILYAVGSQVSGREMQSLPEFITWAATLPGGMRLVRLLSTVDELDDYRVAAYMMLHAARSVHDARGAEVEYTDAAVQSLDDYFFRLWTAIRDESPKHDWLYHPRRTELSITASEKFVSDLLAVCPEFHKDAAAGDIVYELNATLVSEFRRKRLDLVLGSPITPVGPAADIAAPLRKGKVRDVAVSLEVKACMTSHRQATPRLLDELRSSLEVVKESASGTIAVALIVVNTSPTFTNPENPARPNQHVPRDIELLFRKLHERVHLDAGSLGATAYGAVGIVVVDTDNELRVTAGVRAERVQASHTYERALGRVSHLYRHRRGR